MGTAARPRRHACRSMLPICTAVPHAIAASGFAPDCARVAPPTSLDPIPPLTMPDMPLPSRPIDPRHVLAQFQRRDPDRSRFLHDDIAQRLLDRLAPIRLDAARLLDAGCGTAPARALLASRFPEATYTGLDADPRALARARTVTATPTGAGWLPRLRGLLPRATAQTDHDPTFVQADLAHSTLPAESFDLVWSNLALHWHPAPHDVFAEWWRLLRVDGVALFSSYGPDTLREVRRALADAGLRTAVPAWVDMHDLGDLLVEHGFHGPVLDQERLTLTYSNATALLADVRALGGNPARGRRSGLAGRAFRTRLLDALEAQRQPDGRLHLTIEVAFGHAWRGASRRRGTGEVQLSVSTLRPPRRA